MKVAVGELAVSEVLSLSVPSVPFSCITQESLVIISNRNDMNYQQKVKPACETRLLFVVVSICCY